LGREHIGLPPAVALIDERLHEGAQHFRRTPVFGHARPLERLTEFLFYSDAEANVFTRHGVKLSHGYTNVYPKNCRRDVE
jgi:hypothetical protein